MDLEQAIRTRRMCRDFSPDPIPGTTLHRLLDLAARAPSAGFAQGLDWLVIESEASRRLFFEATSEKAWLAEPGPMSGLLEAPVIVVPVGNPGAYVMRYAETDKSASDLAALSPDEWPVPYWTVDASMAVMALLLAAQDAGLGALFFRLHRPSSVLLEAFGVPGPREVIGAVALGHPGPGRGPAGSPGRRRRRPLDESVHRDRW
ncbi:MAG TPA: nitroreductase family protein [Acidimicrobiales bacterium]|jgi:nitroreductase|nr:nitroreductase family protein [Acidimicrobiales bacterium]